MFNFIGMLELSAQRKLKQGAPKQKRYVAEGTSFAPLGEYLERQGGPSAQLSFDEVERLIGKPLCRSARKYASYWYPAADRPISNVIYNAGYDVKQVDLKQGLIYLENPDK